MRVSRMARRLQHGRVQSYVLYILDRSRHARRVGVPGRRRRNSAT